MGFGSGMFGFREFAWGSYEVAVRPPHTVGSVDQRILHVSAALIGSWQEGSSKQVCCKTARHEETRCTTRPKPCLQQVRAAQEKEMRSIREVAGGGG